MSDVQATPAEQEPITPAKGTNPARLVFLLLIFGVALAGLLYDYCIARPNIKKADLLIHRLLEDPDADPNGDGTVTEDEVQSVLMCKPTSVKNVPNGKIETYSWRSGLPYRTYNLYVVYTGSGKLVPLLHAASTNEEPTGDKLPPVTVLTPPNTSGQLSDGVPPQPQAMGMGGGGGKGRGKKRPPAEDDPTQPERVARPSEPDAQAAPDEAEPEAAPAAETSDASQEPPASEGAAAPEEPTADEPALPKEAPVEPATPE